MTIHLTLPGDHPEGAPVFLASTLNHWQPNDERYRLWFDPALNVHVLRLAETPYELQYKFTRGSWETEEVNEAGQTSGNRSWIEGQDPSIVSHQVVAWRDTVQPPSIATKEQTLYLWQEALWMPQLKRSRRIWAYVPPDYGQSDRRYPVVYMHDAQNLFAYRPAQNADWRVAHTLNQLFVETGWGCILIGIEHGEQHRLAEYSPVPNPTHGGGDGTAYLDFLTETPKPLVDATFRTQPEAASTAMIGSSMGGLISVYAALRHGDVFGKVAAFSPSLWWSDDVYGLAAAVPYNFVHKLVLLAGAQESDEMLPDVLAMYYTLIDNGYFEEKIQVDFYQDGTHSEWFWGRELERAIRWLFSDDIAPMPDDPFAVFDDTEHEIRLLKPFVKADLRNAYGKVIYRIDSTSTQRIPIKPHWHGLFALQCLLPNQRIELKKIML